MSEIKQSSKSGHAAATDEYGAGAGAGAGAEHVRSNNDSNDGDSTRGELETTMEFRGDENPSRKIVDNVDVQSAAVVEDEATGRDVIGNANSDIEPSADDIEDDRLSDADEEPVNENESIEGDVATPDSDDCMSDATEEYTMTMSSVDPLMNVDVKADSIQTDQTEEMADIDQPSHDVRRESDNVTVIDESSHEANTSQPESELGNPEDHAIFSPAKNDEEMAYLPVNVDDMIEEVYPEDQRPTRRRYFFVLATCIVVLAIAAAVAISMGQDGTKESLSSSTSTTTSSTAIGEGDIGVDDVTSSFIPSPPVNTQEPSSTQPSLEPSSQYQWLQLAIDNYFDMVQKATSPPSKITLDPSSKPTANTTPPPSTANPTTSKPTTTKPTSDPTTSKPTTAKPTTSNPTLRPTMYPTTANPTPRPSTASPTIKPTTSNPTTAKPTTSNPTPRPTMHPTTANPTPHPSTASPTMKPLNIAELSVNEAIPTQKPSVRPTPQQRKGCITNSIYDEIDRDIEQLKNGISDDKTKAHILGGIVR